MKRLLDYTRSGRWLTIAAADQAAVPDTQQPESETVGPLPDPARNTAAGAADTLPAAASIRRLLEYTICGHWRAPGDPPAPSHLSAIELQRLHDAAFFGVDVTEITAEKWREIAPFFDRSAAQVD